MLDLATGEKWRARPIDKGEAVNHEYWLADGEHVGYHDWRGAKDEPEAFFGRVRYNGTDRRKWPTPDLYTHIYSNGPERVVCDSTYRGTPFDLLWERVNEDEDENGDEEYNRPMETRPPQLGRRRRRPPPLATLAGRLRGRLRRLRGRYRRGKRRLSRGGSNDVTEFPQFDLEEFDLVVDR